MNKELAQLMQNIVRIRREIRLQSRKMQALIEADLDFANAARLLTRLQADQVPFVEKQERLRSPEST
jgi:hypothetical protein